MTLAYWVSKGSLGQLRISEAVNTTNRSQGYTADQRSLLGLRSGHYGLLELFGATIVSLRTLSNALKIVCLSETSPMRK